MGKKNYPYYKVEPFKDFKEMISQRVAAHPDHAAFMYTENKQDITVSYREFQDQINSLGTAIADLGVHGKKIAMVSENSYYWVLVYLTVLGSDNVYIPMDKELPLADLLNVLNHSDTEIIFCSDAFAPKLAENRAQLPNVKHIFCFHIKGELPEGVEDAKAFQAKGKALLDAGDTSYTSQEPAEYLLTKSQGDKHASTGAGGGEPASNIVIDMEHSQELPLIIKRRTACCYSYSLLFQRDSRTFFLYILLNNSIVGQSLKCSAALGHQDEQCSLGIDSGKHLYRFIRIDVRYEFRIKNRRHLFGLTITQKALIERLWPQPGAPYADLHHSFVDFSCAAFYFPRPDLICKDKESLLLPCIELAPGSRFFRNRQIRSAPAQVVHHRPLLPLVGNAASKEVPVLGYAFLLFRQILAELHKNRCNTLSRIAEGQILSRRSDILFNCFGRKEFLKFRLFLIIGAKLPEGFCFCQVKIIHSDRLNSFY